MRKQAVIAAAGLLALAAAAAVGEYGALGAHAATDPLSEARAPFDVLRLSAELARVARAQNDAWSLVAAARLRKQTPVRQVQRAPEAGAAAPAEDPSEGWLDEAERIGGDDPRLEAMVQEVRAIRYKGRAGGPQVSKARVGPGAVHRYGERFEIGRPAVVYVEGDGDTDLMLKVLGPGGDTACAETGPGDVKLCAWTAGRSGSYAVEVLNRGRVENAYAFATN